jgi:hypothetical protein
MDLEETFNKQNIWNCMETAGIKVAISYQFGANKTKSDIFNIAFNNMFWKNIVTETNLSETNCCRL